MTIKAKILSLVAAFTLLAIAITALGLKTMSDYDRIIAAYNHASENAFRGERLNRYLTAAVVDFRGIYMSKNQTEALNAADRVDASTAALATFLGNWRKQLHPGELPEFVQVNTMVLRLVDGGHMISNLTRTKSLAAADAWGNRDSNLVLREQMQAAIVAMVDRIESDQVRSRAALERFKSERQTQFLIMASTGILLLVLGSLWIVIDSIANPLDRVRQSMIRISKGEYDTDLPTTEQSDAMGTEIGELWRALGVLKAHAIEAERLLEEKLKEEQTLRELVLD
jgi:methyl-accepting chemotaxis protein